MNSTNHNDWENLFNQLPADTSVNEEHRERLRQQVLEAREASSAPVDHRNILQKTGRILMKYKAPHCTAAALVVAGIVWLIQGASPALALDEVVDKMIKAHSARFDMTVTPTGLPEQKMKAFFLEPASFRQEMDNGYVNVADWKAGKMIGLDTNSKQATVITLVNLPPGSNDKRQQNQFDAIRDTLRKAVSDPNTKIESLGSKQLGKRKVIGYRFKDGPQPMTVWADPETRIPVSIESTMIGPPKTTVTMSNFEFNVKLDKSIFSTKVPDGYKVMETDIDASKPTEQSMVNALKACSKGIDEFPAGLDAVAIGGYVGKLFVKKGVNNDSPPSKELMQEVVTISRGFQFALLLPPEADAHYAGKGAKVGDSKRPVFWYKPDKSKTYRVVYADLTIKNSATAPKVNGAMKLSR